MEQEAVPAPAGDDDTASSAAAPPFDIEAESAEPSAAGSAPQSPFSSGSECVCCCCGWENARVPVYQLWIPDYELGPWDWDASDATEPDVSLREACSRERALRQWLAFRSGTCVHTRRLSDITPFIPRRRFSAESARRSATAASSLEPSAVSAPPEVPQPKAISNTMCIPSGAHTGLRLHQPWNLVSCQQRVSEASAESAPRTDIGHIASRTMV